MKNKYVWVIGLAVTLAVIIIPLILFIPRTTEASQDPWEGIPVRSPDIDHTALMPGPYESGAEVTRACLECHEDAAHQVMDTVHWTWESKPYEIEGRDEPITIGKKSSNQPRKYPSGAKTIRTPPKTILMIVFLKTSFSIVSPLSFLSYHKKNRNAC